MSSHLTSTWRRPVQASDCESHTTLVITTTLAVGARLVDRLWRVHERVRGMSESPQATRESAGEGVAEKCVRLSQSRLAHTDIINVVDRLGRVWLKMVPVCREVISLTQTPPT